MSIETEIAVGRLTADIKAAAQTMSEREARYLVDTYYAMQDQRIRTAAQSRTAAKEEEPNAALVHFLREAEAMEDRIKQALGIFAEARREGRWLLSIYGIGPVIAAGLLAHIDIRRAPTVGHIWRFAGLDPTVKWAKGQKRPWNASLKVLCWKAGESFKRFSHREECVYGKVYRERKAPEVARDLAGEHAAQAAQSLLDRKIQDKGLRETYEAGRLPAGRLDLRATRYATKLLLSHLHHVLHEIHLGTPPPKPYILTRPEHAHFIAPPGWPCE